MINPADIQTNKDLWRKVFEVLGDLCDIYVNNSLLSIFDILAKNDGFRSRGVILAHFRETEVLGELNVQPVYLSVDQIISAPIPKNERQSVLQFLASYDPREEFIIGACSYPESEDSTDYVWACCPGLNVSSIQYRKYRWPVASAATEIDNERVERNARRAKPRAKQKERQLEDELYDWLRLNGVAAERQVTTRKHRLDLWVPGEIMLELKAGRITGDDVCQAIDYQSTYQKPILLVGKGLSTAASRGVEGFNKSAGRDLLQFVTWNAVKTYLKGALRL